MSANSVASCAGVNTQDAHRHADARVFHPGVRKAVRDVVAAHPAAGELAVTFPALLFALATGFGGARKRARALRLIENGEPLREVADTLGLPWWTRRLPAGAFVDTLDAIPLDVEVARRIATEIPVDARIARLWLWGVCYGYHACGAEFATWVARILARHSSTFVGSKGEDRFSLLAAWAWHSNAPDTPGHRIMRRPWSSAMGLRRALEEAGVWQQRVALVLSLEAGNSDDWIKEGEALGFEFVALKTPQEFISESETMVNCLDQYSERLEAGFSSIYSVRKNGRTVADVEIGRHAQEVTMPSILQLRGRRNRRAPAEVWRAAYAWLGAQPLKARYRSGGDQVEPDLARQKRVDFWKPYLKAIETSAQTSRFRDSLLRESVAANRSRRKRGRASTTKA